ncbi:permease [Marmoricola endophyticus]|uniref:Permease n=1 Tax=Marmoricola endophyticus TaxID=2040280 RepID=A0A917BHI5_9ACTN|nr:ABC transporter permease [Marmoricola endophyticus]GGF42081.1 permease [Marmoricola endophyticus]
MADVATAPNAQADARERTGRKRGPKLDAEQLIELFGIPLIVVVGFVAFAIWRNTATLDSVETNALPWNSIWIQLREHVVLTAVGAMITVVIAVPLGIALTRPGLKRAAPVVVGVANAGQAAPAIGLIVLLAIWFGFGFWTAIVALVLYAVLPVLRNTIVGLQAVDPTLVEAGRGIGMSNLMVLRRIELPLALPVIMSGVRTALVLLVGTAALATFINGGGLGGLLNTGITLFRFPVIVAAAVLIALLALLIEWLGQVLELVFRPKGI